MKALALVVAFSLFSACGNGGGRSSPADESFVPSGTANPAATGTSPAGLGSVTLNWQPPTQNTDGSPLTDLAGYRIYFGNDPEQLNGVIELGNPGLTRYLVEGLEAGTWYFAMTAVNEAGIESALSGQVIAETY